MLTLVLIYIEYRELELLEIPSADWGISVFQWPSTLLANEVRVTKEIPTSIL